LIGLDAGKARTFGVEIFWQQTLQVPLRISCSHFASMGLRISPWLL
jgi:hypothetical protein